MVIKRIECPACGASQFEHDADGNLICSSCGARFAPPGEDVFCPQCGTSNPPRARKCMNCGASLGLSCPACGHASSPGAEFCEECGTRLDTYSAVVERLREVKEGATGARVDRLVASKAKDMQFMEAQRARLDAEEAERRKRLAEQMARARERQHKQMTILLIVAGVVLVMIVVVYIVVRLAGG